MRDSFIDIISWWIEVDLLAKIEKAVTESNSRCCCSGCRAEEEARRGRDTGIYHQNSEWDRDLAKLEADRHERKRISEAEKQETKRRREEEWW